MVGTSGASRVVRETSDTDVPYGLWSYRVDASRVIQGGALSSGGNIFAWLSPALQIPTVSELAKEIAAMPPDSPGLTVLPFLASARSQRQPENQTENCRKLKVLASHDHRAFRSARALRCVGCTRYAMPILAI